MTISLDLDRELPRRIRAMDAQQTMLEISLRCRDRMGTLRDNRWRLEAIIDWQALDKVNEVWRAQSRMVAARDRARRAVHGHWMPWHEVR